MQHKTATATEAECKSHHTTSPQNVSDWPFSQFFVPLRLCATGETQNLLLEKLKLTLKNPFYHLIPYANR